MSEAFVDLARVGVAGEQRSAILVHAEKDRGLGVAGREERTPDEVAVRADRDLGLLGDEQKAGGGIGAGPGLERSVRPVHRGAIEGRARERKPEFLDRAVHGVSVERAPPSAAEVIHERARFSWPG